MRTLLALAALAAVFVMSGCTVFQDDIYKMQAGYYFSGSFDAVDQAIHDEMVARFGKDRVFRADVEWKYEHWTAISDQKAVGLEKYRMRVSAYPQLGADGVYEPVVVAREEVYTGASTGRGGPTAMYSNKWTEAARNNELEVELANGIAARLRKSTAGGK
ncbi:MAG: hypothetical protein KF696_06505 [Planctomycetes bacterium]|nr:hypothetical protein [Planctomycetota bacterium]MCW8136532.1 hypothetical protein [Planctomycetota bacterium]